MFFSERISAQFLRRFLRFYDTTDNLFEIYVSGGQSNGISPYKFIINGNIVDFTIASGPLEIIQDITILIVSNRDLLVALYFRQNAIFSYLLQFFSKHQEKINHANTSLRSWVQYFSLSTF